VVASLEGNNLLIFYFLRAFEICPHKMVASLEGDNQLVFYYLSAFEIWPHMIGGLC
jgi:hypothetical protein